MCLRGDTKELILIKFNLIIVPKKPLWEVTVKCVCVYVY